MTPEERNALLAAKNEKAKAHARELRVKSAADTHALLLSRLSEPRFRALYIAVARLFANGLVGQTALMHKAEICQATRSETESRVRCLWLGSEHPRLVLRTTNSPISLRQSQFSCITAAPCRPSPGQSSLRMQCRQKMLTCSARSTNAGRSHLYALPLVCLNRLWRRADGAMSRTNMSPLSVCTSTGNTSSSMTRSDSRPTWTAWQRARRRFPARRFSRMSCLARPSRRSTSNTGKANHPSHR